MYKNNNINKQANLFTPYEGFINGTLFKTLYEPYKNYRPKKIIGLTDEDKMMLEVQMYYAGLHDLTLYLDVYPEDLEAVKLRNEYYEKYKNAKEEYEKRFNSYSWASFYPTNKPWSYSSTKFQWEMKR